MQRKLVVSFLGLTMAVFLGCETTSNPSGSSEKSAIATQGKGAIQQNLPISLTVPDCEGEMLDVTGQFHVVTKVKQDGKGRFHVMVHGNTKDLVATDSDGNTFTGDGSLTFTGTIESLPLTIQDTVLVTLVSADLNDTLIYSISGEFTLHPDGEITGIVPPPVPICDPDGETGETGARLMGTEGPEMLAAGGQAVEFPNRFAWSPRIHARPAGKT